ncbi:phosphonopyruvate decarboxylase [Methanobrevibacter sp.]|uniref:phosphonopyruvate decarboxylase n=1 Tax=Methanobrevibacter sp. TaxID=66852 RepID=UPI0025E0453B|nr:phosphonopyruvate decarboxylase [Methanobrevibacter sp.]MEE0943626.1 phosphonopyruvate decarboxylase [Methanobrevibacter sp.]
MGNLENMDVEDFVDVLGCEFYTGVPDSQLKALCNYLMNTYGIDEKHHIIAANEGNCTALAAGYHLATGKVPVVYMQNSGEGNIINPVASLLNDKVYAIPCIFVIGWRGQPGIHDEPQHIYQGQITTDLLDLMDIENFVIGEDTSVEELKTVMNNYNKVLESGKSVAFVVRKNALTYNEKVVYENDNEMIREEIISHIVDVTGEDPIVSTTGKASRELFEIRESRNQSHMYDFLTVGSMGHTSSIALGVAINKPDEKVWCVDGDGSALMHLGSMGVVGNVKPCNLVHIVINNGAHETVGGMPTVASTMNLVDIAKSCGYSYTVSVDNFDDLDKELKLVKSRDELSFIEVLCSIGARDDLGRPTTTALENKENFMDFLKDD